MGTEPETRPECGVGRRGGGDDGADSRVEEGHYVFIGAVSGFVALFVSPPVFGLISIVCGVQLFRRRSAPLRLAMMGWGGVGLSVVLILSVRFWT